MRRIFALLLFPAFILHANATSLCICEEDHLLNSAANADFVAVVKIRDAQRNTRDNTLQDLQIETLELFKGESLTNLQFMDGYGTSCHMRVHKGTNWLIFGTKNKEGKISFSFCSGATILDKREEWKNNPKAVANFQKSVELKLQTLRYLKQLGIAPRNPFGLFALLQNQTDDLKSLKGVQTTGLPFALFELTINTDLSLDTLKTLKEFDNPQLQSELKKVLKQHIHFHRADQSRTIPEKTTLVFGIYYYPAEEGYPSFVSTYDV